MKDLSRELTKLKEGVKTLEAELKVYSKYTNEFLKECKKAGISVVSIGRATKRLERTLTYPFNTRGSVFSDNVKSSNGWPAIWTVVNKLGISGGCGNSNQHQVKSSALLMEGVYELKDGKWNKTE